MTLSKNYELKVVVIERPYDTFTTSEFTKDFMANVFRLKFEGYCAKYPYGIMPVSDYDFMATHVCLALVQGDTYVPISAFKSITSEVCADFRVPFPVINHKFGMYKEKFQAYVKALEAWQRDLDEKNELYAYNASWTMKSDLEKELRDLTREISLALFYFHYTTNRITHVINSTSANFNVNKHQEMMGLQYLRDASGAPMDAFKSPVFFEEPFYIMYLNERGFSEIFARKCEAFRGLWESRLVVTADRRAKVKAA